MVAFWYSLVFAVLRTTLTIFVTSSMNDYERKIISSLRDVPSKAWNTEVCMHSKPLLNSNLKEFFLIRYSVSASNWAMI